MRTSRIPTAALLLVVVSIIQESTAGVLYWTREEAANEFLVVKRDYSRFIDYFQRVKRDLFDIFELEDEETATKPDENNKDEENDVEHTALSSIDNDMVEKTLRVTFNVVEPYIKSCSDRESAEFYNFSNTLSNAVEQLYETSIPGTQRTRLVTIHSSIRDEFSCKVTLDIVTTGFDDTDYIVNILRNYIVTYNRLGPIIVNEDGFSAVLIDAVCQPEQFRCESDGRCIEERKRCDGRAHCADGSDEIGCVCRPDQFRCKSDGRCIEEIRKCDGWAHCADGSDELACMCRPGQFRCKIDGRCIEEERRCDGREHCIDGSDELGCAVVTGGLSACDHGCCNTVETSGKNKDSKNMTDQLQPIKTCAEGNLSACTQQFTTDPKPSTSNSVTVKAGIDMRGELELVKKRLNLIEAYLNETIHENIDEENKSDDYYYFMSLLPQMGKFAPLQRYRLRNKINQVIMDELNTKTRGHSNHHYTMRVKATV